MYYTFTRTTVNLGPHCASHSPCLPWTELAPRPSGAEPVEPEGEEPQEGSFQRELPGPDPAGLHRAHSSCVFTGAQNTRATQALGTAWQSVTHSAQPHIFHSSSCSHSAFLEESGHRGATKRYFPLSPSPYSQCQLHRLTLSHPEIEGQASVWLHTSTPKEEQIHSSPEFTMPCPAHCSRGHGGSHLAHPKQQGSLQNLALVLGRRWRSALGKREWMGAGAQNETPGTGMDVTAAPPSRWGAWGRTVGLHPWARQVLLPHLVCCPPGAEAGRRSVGPGLSTSPRPV